MTVDRFGNPPASSLSCWRSKSCAAPRTILPHRERYSSRTTIAGASKPSHQTAPRRVHAHGSIERYAGDAATLGQELLLSPELDRDRVRRTRALMIEIPAARLRQLVLARGKPSLG